MNKVLIVLSIIVSIFLVFCTAVVLLIQFPGFQNSVVDLINPTQVEITTETKETINDYEIEPTVIETTQPLPKLKTTISNYIYKDSVNIEYPIVDGMNDKNLQEKINTKIYNNAKSIVDLYPISTSMQDLNVTANVKELNDNILTIIYEGRVLGYTVKEGESNQNQSQGTIGRGSLSDNPSNNYQLPSSGGTFNSNGINNQGAIIAPNQFPNGQVPNTGNDFQPVWPGSSTVVGFSRTVNVDQKVFYTNTINMKTGEDIYMSQLVKPETLAKYARSSKAEIVNIKEYDEQEIRTYIRKSTVSALTDVFTKADFHNTKMNYWPKSFSYVEGTDLFFTVKLSSKLGNFALIKYSLEK